MRQLFPLACLILLAASVCRTAPAAKTAAKPSQPSRKMYYLMKGPATVGWVGDLPGTWIGTSAKPGGPEHPFRWAAYDPKAEADLASEAQACGSFTAFAERVKQKGYRLVRTKHGP